ELGEDARLTGDEEGRVALPQPQGAHHRLGRLLAEVLGDGAAPGLLIIRPEDIAQARLALALRPGVHAVAEGARTARRRRDGPDGVRRIGAENPGEQAEAAVAEMLG